MYECEEFVVSGVGKELLEKVICANKEFIENFDNINCFFIDKRGILVFCHDTEDGMQRHGYEKYPFKPTIGMLVEHIISLIDSTSEENLGKLGQLPNGYEEDYEYGWTVFKPTGKYWEDDKDRIEVNKYKVSNYDWFHTVLAAYPILVEYGK